MSWFDECPLSHDDFEMVNIYLRLLRIKVGVHEKEILDTLIEKLQKWLDNA